MRLAADRERINNAGAEVIAISVNDDIRQAGMSQRWGLSSIRLVSDPGGTRFLQPLGLYDPAERGGIALTGHLVIGQESIDDDGVVYRSTGRDFADRTADDRMYEALDGLNLPSISPEPVTYSVSVPEDLTGFFRPQNFVPYFGGNRFAAIAIARRLPSKETAAVARQHRMMAEASLESWDRHQPTIEPADEPETER